MMAPTLLVLAAGMGSRYGGLKQLDPVGPSGETILDYSVFDALRAGFGRVVFVIRHDFEAVFREKIGARYEKRIDLGYAFQEKGIVPDGVSVPAGREKPWGTGHAVWCARDQLGGPFAAINADDFYGADAFAQLSGFLGSVTPRHAAMVGFRLGATLSEHGAVSRGICRSSGAILQSIEEATGITPEQVGPGLRFTGTELVSMKCWGFGADFFPGLDSEIKAFFTARSQELSAEFYLPSAVSGLVTRELLTVQVLPTASEWFGVTYREDKPRVSAAIAALVARGTYPETLF